jgi:hypothetical protein
MKTSLEDFWKKQKELNQLALKTPKVGDYWTERFFIPYFLVVKTDHVKNQYTVLSCIGENKANIDNKDGTWSFDYTRHQVVDRDWIKDKVTYSTNNLNFVADVRRDEEKSLKVVDEWKKERIQNLLDQLKSLGPDVSKYLLEAEW